MEKMRDLLRTEEDWCKGHYFHGCKMCLLGASRKLSDLSEDTPFVFRGDTEHYSRTSKLSAAIRKLFPKRPSAVSSFNDHPNTTFEDVCQVIKEAGV